MVSKMFIPKKGLPFDNRTLGLWLWLGPPLGPGPGAIALVGPSFDDPVTELEPWSGPLSKPFTLSF